MSDKKVDRRTILKTLSAASLAPFWPACSTPEPDAPDPGSVQEAITHTVILMMENRTFDHYFGSLSLLEGRTDVEGLRPEMFNVGLDGTEYFPRQAPAPCVPDPPHGWNDTHTQWNNGAQDGFVSTYESRWGDGDPGIPMDFWTRKDLPALYALADNYTLCQAWFQSLLSSTWPNRFYSHAASNNAIRGNDFGAVYDMPTIYQRLEAKGIEWGCYHLTAPFMVMLQGHFSTLNFWPMDVFYQHCQAGSLPQVSILEPFYGRADDHPPAHPKAGQILISSIYRALAASPLWGKVQLFITYDEHGGFFDHVPPPEFPDQHADEGFGQAGFRVPSLSIGPYVKEGHVCNTVYDHTSLLAFMESLYDLEPLNERDAAANDLFDTLDADRIAARNPAAPIDMPVVEAEESEIYAEECMYDLGRDRELMHQPEFETWLDQLPMQHPTDNRHRFDEDYDDFLALTEAMGVWRRA